MPFVTETLSDDDKALVVFQETSPFMVAFLEKVKDYSLEIVQREKFPLSLRNFSYIFVYHPQDITNIVKKLSGTSSKSFIITTNRKDFTTIQKLVESSTRSHIKLVNIDENDTSTETLERVLWFMMSSSKEKWLNLENVITPLIHKEMPTKGSNFELSRKQIRGLIIFLFFFIQLFFLIPLAGSSLFLYQAGAALKEQRLDSAQKNINIARPMLSVTKKSYVISRPLFLFLFVSLYPENIIAIEDNGIKFIQSAINTSQNSHEIIGLMMKKNKSATEIEAMKKRLAKLNQEIESLTETSEAIKDRMDYKVAAVEKWRTTFETINKNLAATSKLATHLETMVGGNGRRQYLIFFYNNMEIRPGGGFIGSFATINFSNYTLEEFKVYDVYDADGQLESHVEPPLAIRKYLGEVHWFLRDSNFSPDFEQNTKTAEYFIDQELALGQFDGAIGITTTALSYLIEAFGNVQLIDSDEMINKDNFYPKIQADTEKDFFAGSTQKKNVLSSLGRTLFLKMEEASPGKLALAFKRSLDEKHLVIFMKDTAIKKDIDRLGWGGKIVAPQCVSAHGNCVINHLFPIDANLGVNKVNYFVHRSINLTSVINEDGTIDNTVSVLFANNSPSDQKPGGTYKNYFQLYLPHDSWVKSVSHNSKAINSFQEGSTNIFKTVGTFIEIPPGETFEVSVDYQLESPIINGANAYQIVIQKQIGSFNSDFFFEVQLPSNIFITNQNFKSLAKNHTVRYNSSLSTDRIFVIELVKE